MPSVYSVTIYSYGIVMHVCMWKRGEGRWGSALWNIGGWGADIDPRQILVEHHRYAFISCYLSLLVS